MGYANNIITGPVSVYDVQRCFGTSRNDVGDLIANVEPTGYNRNINFKLIALLLYIL